MKKIIVDGDWGGDEMALVAVLGARKDVKILGATCTFGNAPHADVLRNALDILSLLKINARCYPGAKAPLDQKDLEGDGAHGSNGVGGVVLPRSSQPAETINAEDFILDSLRKEPANTVCISATGPLTNLAAAIKKDSKTMQRVQRIFIMGGCTKPLPAADMTERAGNITPYAEFNWYMAANDARTVMGSGLPITLLPMNCTQQLSLTPERESLLRNALSHVPVETDLIVRMMKAPEALDRMKFNASPFMHDIHTALCFLHPEEYRGTNGHVRVVTDGEKTGHSEFTPDETANIAVMEQPLDPDRLFNYYLQSLQTLFA